MEAPLPRCATITRAPAIPGAKAVEAVTANPFFVVALRNGVVVHDCVVTAMESRIEARYLGQAWPLRQEGMDRREIARLVQRRK
jgi:hypothetical protein